jgi:muramoyltetrapeptide carboxypeptidase
LFLLIIPRYCESCDLAIAEGKENMKIGICAPSTPFTRQDADIVTALAQKHAPTAQLVWNDQCYAQAGHFAGDDALRAGQFVQMANDPELGAIWFARGGYGAARIASDVIAQLNENARGKIYMGYSDGGNLLGALYKAQIGRPVHGPMPGDIRREGGEAAVIRALDWMAGGGASALEPHMATGQSYAAFNLMTLAMMAGTPLMPDLSGHILMIEEVSEYMYAFDRAMFCVTSYFADKGLAGLMLGRVSDVPENDRPFGEDAEMIARRWCHQSGIGYLGRADIGHDVDNKIVPFGLFTA